MKLERVGTLKSSDLTQESPLSKRAPPSAVPSLIPADGVRTSVAPSIQDDQQAEAALSRITREIGSSSAQAVDAFKPSNIARIEGLLADD